jgi:hypothetical protein
MHTVARPGKQTFVVGRNGRVARALHRSNQPTIDRQAEDDISKRKNIAEDVSIVVGKALL